MERLRKYLAKSRTTQKQFGDALGVSQPVVSTWMLGTMAPGILRLRGISDISGLSVEQLVLDIEEDAERRESMTA